MAIILRKIFVWFAEQVAFVCNSLASLLFLALVMAGYSAICLKSG